MSYPGYKMKKFIASILISLLVFIAFSFGSANKAYAQSCVNGTPTPPLGLTTRPGPLKGEVTLSWTPATSADSYAVVYGLSSKNYMFGALDLGSNSRSIIIRSLVPAKRYFFSVWAYCSNGMAAASGEKSGVAAVNPRTR